MPKRPLEGMRILVAILLIALYAFAATASASATASSGTCTSHPCCEAKGITQPHDGDGDGGPHAHQHGSHHDMMSAEHARDGKAPQHTEPNCGFGCSVALGIDACGVTARRSAAPAVFSACARDPDDQSPELLIRPPRFPFA